MHTLDKLIAAGYSVQNAKITNVSLNTKDYGCLTLAMTLEGCGWGVVYGGYCLGKGYLGAEEFEGSAKGMEAIMRIMNVVGVSDLLDMKDKYIRAATKGWGSTVKIIGNIIMIFGSTMRPFSKGRSLMRAKIIAVDFDGTLIEEGKWPGIGATNEKVLNYCKTEQAKGARIILWTNRIGEPLEVAVKWCEEHGLRLDAVNDNLPESVEFFGTNTRKIYADEFIDDRMAKDFNLPYLGGSELVPLQQVLCDMSNPDGGYAAMSARDYYYKHYATEEERKVMDRHDNFVAAFGILLMIAIATAAIFEIVSTIT